jgi:hypothetical protein
MTTITTRRHEYAVVVNFSVSLDSVSGYYVLDICQDCERKQRLESVASETFDNPMDALEQVNQLTREDFLAV